MLPRSYAGFLRYLRMIVPPYDVTGRIRAHFRGYFLGERGIRDQAALAEGLKESGRI